MGIEIAENNKKPESNNPLILMVHITKVGYIPWNIKL